MSSKEENKNNQPSGTGASNAQLMNEVNSLVQSGVGQVRARQMVGEKHGVGYVRNGVTEAPNTGGTSNGSRISNAQLMNEVNSLVQSGIGQVRARQMVGEKYGVGYVKDGVTGVHTAPNTAPQTAPNTYGSPLFPVRTAPNTTPDAAQVEKSELLGWLANKYGREGALREYDRLVVEANKDAYADFNKQVKADTQRIYDTAASYTDPGKVNQAKAAMEAASAALRQEDKVYNPYHAEYLDAMRLIEKAEQDYDTYAREYGADSYLATMQKSAIEDLYSQYSFVLSQYEKYKGQHDAAQAAYDKAKQDYNDVLLNYYAYLPYRWDFVSGTSTPEELQPQRPKGQLWDSPIAPYTTPDSVKRLQELSQQDVDVYNYLLTTQGYDAAQEYLDFIKEELNRRAGQTESERIEDTNRLWKFAERSGLSVRSGLENAANGIIGNFVNEPLPVSATQFARMYNREEQAHDGLQRKSDAYKELVSERNGLRSKAQSGKGLTAQEQTRLRELNEAIAKMEDEGTDREALTILGSTTSQIWNDLLFTGMNMAPTMAIGAATGMPLLGSGGLGFSAAGNAYQEKLREGWTNDEARAYGTLVGISESTLTYLLSGIGGLGAASSVGTKISGAMSKLGSNPATKFVFTMLGRAIPEAIEEGAQSILEPVFEAAVRKTDFNAPNWEQVFYDALMGGIMGMVMGGGHTGNVQTNTETQQTTPTAQTPQAEQRAAPAAETRQTAPVQPNVSPEAQAILSKDSLSNNDVRRILDDASLRAEIESVVGAPVPIDRSSASNQRAAVKEYFNTYKSQSRQNATQETQASEEPQTAPQTENASTDDSQGLNSTDAVTQALQTIGVLPQTEQNAPVSPVQTTETVAADPVQQRLEDLGILPPQTPTAPVQQTPAQSPVSSVPPSTNGIQSEGAAPMQTQPNTPQTPKTGTEVNSQNLGQGTARPQVEGGDLVATQTHGSDSLYTDAERSMEGLRPEDSVHERHTDAAVDAVVEQRYQADRDGEKAYLFESGERWTDADTALAHRILADAVEEARKTGDYSEVVRLQREWERQGTTEGQALRQRGRFVESPEHIVAEAAEALSGESARQDLTPTERNEIIGQVDQLAHEAASITEGDTASVIEMIKRLNEVRRTTGLFSTKTGKGLSRALEQAAKMPDGYAFLKSVLNAQIRGVANDYTSPGAVNVIQTIRNQNMLSNFTTILTQCAELAICELSEKMISRAIFHLHDYVHLADHLMAEAREHIPLMRFVVSVRVSPEYGDNITESIQAFSRRYESYVQLMAQRLSCDVERIRPIVYMMIVSVVNYMIFGEPSLFLQQFTPIQKELGEIVSGQKENEKA